MPPQSFPFGIQSGERTLDFAAIHYPKQVGAASKMANKSTIRKPAVAAAGRHPVMRVVMAVRIAVLITVLMFANLFAVAIAQSECPGIHVNILNIKNSTGTVACALFESPDGFPTEFLASATNVMIIKIRKTQARCDFLDIPPGTYAMAVVHDENMNGKLDTNLLGIPEEGYGFSNDAKGVVGPPSFVDASFTYEGGSIDLTMALHY